eukprot:scaffold75351_cov58-Phaeocystis_antarctica.AAC.1
MEIENVLDEMAVGPHCLGVCIQGTVKKLCAHTTHARVADARRGAGRRRPSARRGASDLCVSSPLSHFIEALTSVFICTTMHAAVPAP